MLGRLTLFWSMEKKRGVLVIFPPSIFQKCNLQTEKYDKLI